MNIALKLALAAIATATGVTAVQNVPVVPATSERVITLNNDTLNVGQATANTQNERVLTLEFNGTIEQLAQSLKKEGVNFVIRPSDANDRIMVNFDRAPMRSAMRAIGRAMGGTFIEDDGVYTFQKGSVFGELYRDTPVPGSRLNTDIIPLVRPDDKGMAKELDYRFYTSDPKQYEALKKQYGNRAKLLKPGEAGAFGFDPKAFEEIRRVQVEGFKMDEKALKALADSGRLSQEAMKELAEVRRFKVDPKAMKELAKVRELRMDPKAFKELEEMRGFAFTMDGPGNQQGNMMKVLDSLSKAQREQHQKQGFLRYSDLTAAQQKMLGLSVKGQWEISVNNNGKKLTIKSDR